MMNLVEQARALQETLERVHEANPYAALEARYSVLKDRIAQVVKECDVYFDRVGRARDEQTPKCPACGHAWGYHPSSGEYNEHLGCSFGLYLEYQGQRCGCQESQPK